MRELARRPVDFRKVCVGSNQRLPDRIVEWCHGTNVRLNSPGHPVYPSLALELEGGRVQRDWIRRLLRKIHVLDTINGMSEELRSQAAELFRRVGGEAVESG